MNLFTVQLELGPETRAMIERLAANLLPKDSKKKEGVEGLLRKGADAVRK